MSDDSDARKDALGQAIYFLHSSASRRTSSAYSICAAKADADDGTDAVIATAEAFYKFLTQERQTDV